jgi:hypothetical protein
MLKYQLDVDDWKEFEARLEDLTKEQKAARRAVDFLFRGHENSEWPLRTTLERRWTMPTSVKEYYGLINALNPHVEAFTNRRFALREWAIIERGIDSLRLVNFPNQAEYAYMAYLRHHGFPSPLLDWTRSPYIAAYFAFRSASVPKSGKASIYVLSNSPHGYKSHSAKESHIVTLGHGVTTHKRHFLQQSEYTICVNSIPDWHFTSHHDAFNSPDPYKEFQDFLWKFNIPWTERTKVLRLLDAHNLNGLSLFESEEALMETLALREMDFRIGG